MAYLSASDMEAICAIIEPEFADKPLEDKGKLRHEVQACYHLKTVGIVAPYFESEVAISEVIDQYFIDNPPIEESTVVLTGLQPVNATCGNADLELTVLGSGSGFTSLSKIIFNGTEAETTFINSGRITTIISPLEATPGVVPVLVRTNELDSTPLDFTFLEKVEEVVTTLSLTALEPDSAVLGTPDISMVCVGTGFVDGESVIVFNSFDEPTTFIDTEHVSTGVKPSIFSVPEPLPVKVRNLTGETATLNFTFLPTGGAPPEGGGNIATASVEEDDKPHRRRRG